MFNKHLFIRRKFARRKERSQTAYNLFPIYNEGLIISPDSKARFSVLFSKQSLNNSISFFCDVYSAVFKSLPVQDC